MRSRPVPSSRPAVPAPLRAPLGSCAVAAAMLLGVLGISYAGQGAARGLDLWLRSAVTELVPGPRQAAQVIDFGAEPVGAVLVLSAVTLVLALGGRWRLSVVALGGAVLTVVLTWMLKPVVGRTIHDGFLAFPSGHTAFATAIALVAGMLLAELLRVGRLAGTVLVVVVAVTGGALMAWSQVVLDAHYPTDAIGGFCAAMAVVPLVALSVDWFADRVMARADGA